MKERSKQQKKVMDEKMNKREGGKIKERGKGMKGKKWKEGWERWSR